MYILSFRVIFLLLFSSSISSSFIVLHLLAVKKSHVLYSFNKTKKMYRQWLQNEYQVLCCGFD